MTTTEERLDAIASEAAESLVEIEVSAMGWHVIHVGPSIWVDALRSREAAETRVARCVEHLAEGIRDALDRGFRLVPCATPLSEERLAEIVRSHKTLCIQRGKRPDELGFVERDRADLLDQVHFLTALVRDLAADGALAIYEQGAEAQRKACANAVGDLPQPYWASAVASIMDAPLAVPDEPKEGGS